MKSMSVSRRTLLTGTVALGTVGLLAACGSSKEKVGGSAANNAEDILKNLQVNKQDRSSLKQGGTLTLAATALGPNFNLQTQSGYTSSNLDALAPCNIPAVMGFYTMSPEGEGSAPNTRPRPSMACRPRPSRSTPRLPSTTALPWT